MQVMRHGEAKLARYQAAYPDARHTIAALTEHGYVQTALTGAPSTRGPAPRSARESSCRLRIAHAQVHEDCPSLPDPRRSHRVPGIPRPALLTIRTHQPGPRAARTTLGLSGSGESNTAARVIPRFGCLGRSWQVPTFTRIRVLFQSLKRPEGFLSSMFSTARSRGSTPPRIRPEAPAQRKRAPARRRFVLAPKATNPATDTVLHSSSTPTRPFLVVCFMPVPPGSR